MKQAERSSHDWGCLLGFVGWAAVFGILGWQGYVWLKTGHLPQLTLYSVLLPALSGTEFGNWLANPQSWYGLRVVVKFLMDGPLFLWVMVAASIPTQFAR